MYIFVRLTAVVTILFGVLLMLAGLSGAGYGFFQNDALTLTINNFLEQTNDMRRVVNAGYATVIMGTLTFIFGMFAAALGQLLLVFVDLATHTRETNLILRSFRARSNGKQAVMSDDEKMYGTELESVG
jgi:hypothetical protein